MHKAIFLFIQFIALVGSILVYGQSLTPKYSNEFLNLGVGARALGMGNTAVSTTSDVTAGYWNPASLTSIESNQQMMLMHASYFAGIANYDFGAFALKLDNSSAFSISLLRFSVDDIPDTRFLFDANGALNYDRIRFFSAADYALLLSYAKELKSLGGIQAGANVKIIHRTVGNFSKAWGFGIDVGLQKEWQKWKAGLVIRDVFGTFNAWNFNSNELREAFQLTGNEVPINSMEITLPRIVFGFSRLINISEHFSALTAFDFETTFDGKRNTLIKSNFASIDPKLGVELSYKRLAFFRLGMGRFQQVMEINGDQSWSFQPNAGLGFVIREITIDYAFTDATNQAVGLYSHIFSVKINFSAKE